MKPAHELVQGVHTYIFGFTIQRPVFDLLDYFNQI